MLRRPQQRQQRKQRQSVNETATLPATSGTSHACPSLASAERKLTSAMGRDGGMGGGGEGGLLGGVAGGADGGVAVHSTRL